jgi:hypothetical protein
VELHGEARVRRELAREFDRLVADVHARYALGTELLNRESVLAGVALEVQDGPASQVAE